nr:folate-binding protein [Corynebacterium mendelii]
MPPDSGSPAGLRPEEAGSDTVAWHYGGPLEEQMCLSRGGATVTDRSHLSVVEISGADALDLCNRLFSQKLDGAPDGYAAGMLNLNAQGHVLHSARIALAGTTLTMITTADQAESLVAYIESMRFWSQVTVTPTTHAVLTVMGSGHRLPQTLDGEIARIPIDWLGPQRTDVIVRRESLAAAFTTLSGGGFTPAGLMAFTAERVKALDAYPPLDLTPASIPHEVWHWIGTADHPGFVHLDKGCYRGQETVSRVHNLGRSPKVLALVHLDGSAPDLPAPGESIVAGRRSVGRLGTVVHDCDLGPIGLAVIKRSALSSGGLHADGQPITVDTDSVPGDDAPRPGRVAIAKLKGTDAT